MLSSSFLSSQTDIFCVTLKAKIASLPPEYGLYSSFVGVVIYTFLGTSKDISIGKEVSSFFSIIILKKN